LKAFLLAAGHGTRLRPLTDRIPKCLLPVRGTPILEIWLDACQRCGIEEVLINIHAHAAAVCDFLNKRSRAIKIHLVEETKLLGSAGTLWANREWVGSENLFWVFYADVLNRVDFAAMLRLHQSRSPAATLAVYKVPDPARCGIVDVAEDGIIREFVEKPAQPKGNLAFGGLLIGTPLLMQMIPPNYPADIGFDVLPRLAGKMLAYPVSDYLLDIGTVENYRKAQSSWPGL
jgi:mannose-1-phosphate guanylyltransferase